MKKSRLTKNSRSWRRKSTPRLRRKTGRPSRTKKKSRRTKAELALQRASRERVLPVGQPDFAGGVALRAPSHTSLLLFTEDQPELSLPLHYLSLADYPENPL